ncbi:IclR family transcriptional regulator [Microbacterium sp. DT81.1]|uniref:IclR family transcriptional regulator n=1 Tax=Microbacterium sp. DT81.1 TaxID=3393413 RepID=UPI003CF62102
MPRAPMLYAQVGSRLPLHATGVGKVLLAYSPQDVVEHVMHHLAQFTSKTIVDAESLQRELELIRQRGFAQTREELHMGTAAIAVPIVDGEGSVESALGMVTSDVRKDLSKLLPALQVTARGIARSLPPRHGTLAA